MLDDDDDPKQALPPPQLRTSLISPQVLAALITGTVALVVALVPLLTHQPSSAPIPTMTPLPPTATEPPQIAPSSTLPPTALPMSQATPVPPTEAPPRESAPANARLIYDDRSFTLYNQGSATLNLSEISFRSANGRWDASNWGPVLARSFPADNCLRLRDAASSQRQPPAICGGNLYGLQLVGPMALFWLTVDSFDVLRQNEVIAQCPTSTDTCAVFIP